MSVDIAQETHAPAGEDFPVARLESYLRSRLELPPAPLIVEQFRHGHSNLTYLIRCGDTKWVLRRPPRGNVARRAHDMGRESRFMAALCDPYPLAPCSFFYCEDEGILGAPFHLVQYRAGVALRQTPPGGELPPPVTMTKLCRRLVEGLASLHAVDYRRLQLADAERADGYAARQVSGWRRRYEEAETHNVPAMTEIGRWLSEQLPRQPALSVIHNDFKFDNLLLDPLDLSSIVAVLDWEMAAIGDPLMDLGTTLALWMEPSDPETLKAVRPGPTLWPGSFTRAEVVDNYIECSGRAVGHVVFYYCYGLFKLAVIFQQSYARYRRGEADDPRFAGYDQKVAALAWQALSKMEAGRL